MDNEVQMELVPKSLIYHALGMNLIVFVVFPCLALHSITSSPATESRFKTYQTICALFLMAVGTLEYFPAFAWMHQERYIASESLVGVYRGIDFIGHYIPSYALTISGVYFIWNHQEMERIMNWEMYIWMIPAVISVFDLMIHSNGHKSFLHHVMLEGIAVILGFVSLLIYKLKVFLIQKITSNSESTFCEMLFTQKQQYVTLLYVQSHSDSTSKAMARNLCSAVCRHFG